MQTQTTLSATALQISGLTKSFGTLKAVDNISFGIFKNEVFGLLGPNGAGKTTVINMICGLLHPDSGTIFYGNRKSFKDKVGYCPQENIYYPRLTCMEQLLFAGNMYGLGDVQLKQRAIDLLTRMGLADKTDTLAGKLSGGMKRRLNICLALIHDPEILILDEPEAGLDPQSRVLVRDFIKSLGKEKTIILTTHNMDEADRLADRIAIIDHGKLLLLDTPEKLKKTTGKGDILEMLTANATEKIIIDFSNRIRSLSISLVQNGNTLLLKHSGLMNHLPGIIQMAEASGLIISELRFRENTLEDVFIYLTGRSLRS